MILLDTNVLSAVTQRNPDQIVATWLDSQPSQSIWITAVTLMETLFGLRIMPVGHKRTLLTRATTILLEQKIQGRIAPFDVPAAEQAAELMAMRKSAGRMMDSRDTMIAGIALATRATLATRNTSHFSDLSVPVINPWQA